MAYIFHPRLDRIPTKQARVDAIENFRARAYATLLKWRMTPTYVANMVILSEDGAMPDERLTGTYMDARRAVLERFVFGDGAGVEEILDEVITPIDDELMFGEVRPEDL